MGFIHISAAQNTKISQDFLYTSQWSCWDASTLTKGQDLHDADSQQGLIDLKYLKNIYIYIFHNVSILTRVLGQSCIGGMMVRIKS